MACAFQEKDIYISGKGGNNEAHLVHPIFQFSFPSKSARTGIIYQVKSMSNKCSDVITKQLCSKKGILQRSLPVYYSLRDFVWISSMVNCILKVSVQQGKSGVSQVTGNQLSTNSAGSQTKNTAIFLWERQSNLSGDMKSWSEPQRRHMYGFHYLPDKPVHMRDRMNSKAYIGQYSHEGDYFIGETPCFLYSLLKGQLIRRASRYWVKKDLTQKGRGKIPSKKIDIQILTLPHVRCLDFLPAGLQKFNILILT